MTARGARSTGGTGWGSAPPRPVHGALQAAAAVAWAYVAMAGLAVLGLWLMGVGRYASLGATTAAVVAMGVGGRVSPSGDLQLFGLNAAAAQGAIDVVPLGVTVLGALVLGWLFVRPLRRRAAPAGADLAVRAITASAVFLALLALVAWAGNGTVSVDLGSVTGGGGTGGGSGGGSGGSGNGGLGGLLGGLGNLGDLGSAIAGITGARPTVGFRVDLGATLLGGTVFVLSVCALALLVSRRVPLPPGRRTLDRTVRPAASAVTAVLLGAIAAGAVAGVIDGLAGRGGRAAVGGVLLGTPNGVFLAVPLGMGVPLNGRADGLLARFLPKPVDQLLQGGGGRRITVADLAGYDGRVWLLVAAVALMLLATGVLAAVRTPRVPGEDAVPRLRTAAAIALRTGAALAVAVPCALALAEVAVNADVSVFGFDASGSELGITGSLPWAALLGFAEGTAAGLLGALLLMRAANSKRPAPPPPPGPPDGTPRQG